MVKQVDLQKPGRLGEPPREAVVGIARRGIAGGVVVRDNDGVGGVNQRGAEDFARMGDGFVETAERNLLDAHHAMFRVEEDHAERFPAQCAHLGAEQFIDEFGRVDFRFAERLGCQPAAEAECGGELHRLGEAHAFDGRDLLHAAPGEAGERFELGQELARDIHGIRAGDAGAEQDGDELAVAQGRRAEARQFFARPVLGRHFMDRKGDHAATV